MPDRGLRAEQRFSGETVAVALMLAPIVVFIVLLWADIFWFLFTGHDFGGFKEMAG